jgi:arylsulfatase A-like enzyme
MPEHRPNVVFLCLDALCRGHVGAYGHPRPTPNIDRFAEANTLFLNAYSAGTWTPPAICSILTGKYPAVPRKMSVAEHDAYHTAPPRLPDNPLFRHSPQDLHLGCPLIDYSKAAYCNIIDTVRRHGYRTCVITSSPFLAYFALHVAEDVVVIEDQIPPALAAGPAPVNRSAEKCWEALGTMRLRSPFFLYIHVTQPHKPYRPQAAFRRYGAHVDHRKEEADLLKYRDDNIAEIVQRRIVVAKQLIDDYDDNLASADHYVGRILRLLDDVAPGAMTFLFSDHGEHFYTNGKWYFEHPTAIYGADMLDASLPIPLVGKVPGWPQQQVAASVKLIDLFPTVMKELGLPVPPGLDGNHLLEDDGIIKAVCSNLGRMAERKGGAWDICEIPESPPLELAPPLLTAEETTRLRRQMKALGYE